MVRTFKHKRDEEGRDKRKNIPSSKYMKLNTQEEHRSEEEGEEVSQKKEDKGRSKPTNVLEGLVFVVVDLMEGAKGWKDLIKQHGGSVTSVLSKKVDYLVATYAEVKVNTYKIHSALKYKIPIVSVDYLLDCCEKETLLDYVSCDNRIDLLVGEVECEEKEDKSPKEDKTSSTKFNELKFSNFVPRTYITPRTSPPPSAYSFSNNTSTTSQPTSKPFVPTKLPFSFSRDFIETNKASTENKLPPPYRSTHSGMAKIYDASDPKAPFFPQNYQVIKNDVLHFTDLEAGINKYYGMELHEARENGKVYHRIYTTYGKTDDLLEDHSSGETKRKADCRYVDSIKQAQILYDLIFEEKVSQKGYQVVSLESKTVGSSKPGTAERDIDALMEDDKEPLDPSVRELVHYLYSEASLALKERIAGKITDRGIETPLGILSLSQIEQGEKILLQMSSLLLKNPLPMEEITKLSGKFYSLIPHKIGQTTNVFSTPFLMEEKQELLQTMKDLVSVSETISKNTSDVTKMQYHALRCSITLPKNSAEFESIAQQTIIGSGGTIKDIEAVYKIGREAEHKNFTNKVFNLQLLYHGSNIGNWLGILSRGILLPKRVVSLGVSRTDAGQLGYGIYFGNRSLTSSRYSTEGKKGTSLMAMCTVALGNVYETQTSKWHFAAAPMNYHSCHGVPMHNGDFKDPHFAVYQQNQVRLEYLIEFVKNDDTDKRGETQEEDEESEQALTRKNDANLITCISDLKKSSTNWRIAVRVTYKSELLLWSSAKSKGNFFTVDFVDSEKGRIHATAFRAHAIKLFPSLEEDKVYEISGGTIRDIHENFTSIQNGLEMVLDQTTTITPLDSGVANNIPPLEVQFLPISQVLSYSDGTVVDFIGLVTNVTEITELVSKHGNTIPRRILTMTCPLALDQSTTFGTGPTLRIEDFPVIQVALWYKDATQLTIKLEDIVAITKAQVNEYKGTKKLNTKHCSHHIYINPSVAQFKEVSAMNMWAAEWFNAQNRAPTPIKTPTEPLRPSPSPFSTIRTSASLPTSHNPPQSDANSSSLHALTPREVAEWMHQNNLGKYAETFEENEISGEILGQLSSAMLKTELGVIPFGHRFVILKAFNNKAIVETKRKLIQTPRTFAPEKQKDNNKDKDVVMTEEKGDSSSDDDKYHKRKTNSSSMSANPEAHTITDHTPRAQITASKIFDNFAQFVRRELDDTEKATSHTVFVTPQPDFYTPFGLPSCVENYEVFRRNFAEYTRAQLSNFNWANMLVAGGSVFTSLKRESNKSNMFNGPSKSGDIDIFLIGLDAAAAERKIHALYNHIKNSNPNPFIIVRTNFAISFVSEFPNRTIQVILRLYSSIEEVLGYFDLDCVSVGYDGSNVFALPRAIRAFNTRTNFVNVLRFKIQSGSNDSRMIKYYRRGFGTSLSLEQALEKGGLTSKVNAKIKALQRKEVLTDPSKRTKETFQIDKLIELEDEIQKEQERLEKTKLDEDVAENDDNAESAPTEKEKYEDVSFIPFGKGWNASKIQDQLQKKLKESEDAHKAKGSAEPFVPFYIVGTFEEIMGLTPKSTFTAKWGKFPHKLQWNHGWA